MRHRDDEKITVKGILPGVIAGEFAQFTGTWERHSKFGLQFNAATAERELPTNAFGIEKYLGSGFIKGIGPEMAKRLVTEFGDRTLEVIDKYPRLLLQVPGIGEGRAQMIQQGWIDQREISRVMVFLRAKEIPVGLATKIYKQYGQDAVQKITDNPYRLTEDLWGVGFKTADTLALKLGIDPASDYRIRAAIIHSLRAAMDQGHLYLDVEEIKAGLPELLTLPPSTTDIPAAAMMGRLFEEDAIRVIKHNNKVYASLPTCYGAEKGIATRIARLKEYPARTTFDQNRIYETLRQQAATNTISLSDDQQRSILAALHEKITIITGGPGTGKTTLLRTLLDILTTERARFALAAPTGRAAKRMFEGTGRPAKTLHRLLEVNPQTMRFDRNEDNTLETDFLIIDETSMLDVFLMHAVLKATPIYARLILIGDIDQLPSVGPGNILGDLITSNAIHTVRLTHIFRQAQDSLIIQNAHKVNRGEFPTSSLPGSRNDFFFVKMDDPEKLPGFLHATYARLSKKYGIEPENMILLTPMHRGSAGAQNLNHVIQGILNPADGQPPLSRMGREYRAGDQVMQIRNNYDKFIFNGDIGTITAVDPGNNTITVKFGETTEHLYESSELEELTHAYAVSIHKSQGSEFDAVIIPLFCQHFIMLQRNLIYTAITRAKKLCILVGEPRAVAMAIKNNKTTKRNSFLVEFLTTELAAERNSSSCI